MNNETETTMNEVNTGNNASTGTMPVGGAMKNIPIGEVMKEAGYVTAEQLNQVLDYQKNSGTKKRVGDLLIELGYITEQQKLAALGQRMGVEILDLSTYKFDSSAVEKIPKSVATKNHVIAVSASGNQLQIATSDPLDFYAIEEVRMATGMQISLVLSEVAKIDKAIEVVYSEIDAKLAAHAASETTVEQVDFFDENTDAEASDADAAPVVRLLNSLLLRGYNTNTTDIHIEPFEKETTIRMRIDGMLINYVSVPPAIHQALVARTKILSHLDIAEKRIPQDGHFKIILENVEMNIRVSVIPTVFGEKIVMRYLNSNTPLDHAETFGMSEENYKKFLSILKNPNGILYITGPTGSGKTTTLYMALDYLAAKPINIATIEDPVERNIAKVNQMQVNNATGLTFDIGLRALLRQDPDVIMIGETRDNETAKTSARAALTGHFVVSTLHTNDAISSISRLRDMGLDNYLISGAVVGLVAQRLVRKNCPYCTKEYVPSREEQEKLGVSVGMLRKGVGCHMCNNTGYKGRKSIHEIVELDSVVKKMIADDKPIDNIYAYMLDVKQMSTLKSEMLELVLKGETTVDEFERIAYSVQ